MTALATVHHGDNREWLATLPPDSHDICVSDPPYSDVTHQNAMHKGDSTSPQYMLRAEFPPVDFGALRDTLGLIGTVTRRWIVITCDWRHAAKLAENPPVGLNFVRFGVWVKPNAVPQFTGDRPGNGWEAMAWLHRAGVKTTWQGGGRSSVFTHNIRTSSTHPYPTQKPLGLMREVLSLVSDDGPVLDPWCGSGTTGVAAVERSLGYSGCDINEQAVTTARSRITEAAIQGTLFATLAPAKQQKIDL